ncbi:MAG: osmotically inducible protein OsmC [Bacteroidetes bacterium]|nr:MAG: osmotically inducible protein OsmC [Bacteroidota bacterium]
MGITRKASARWTGTGKEGNGTMSTHSGVLNNTQYSYNTRFADGIGTNPEELIGAAHAGCFSMKLAFVLVGAGITPESIDTSAEVILDSGAITTINLSTKVKASGLTAEKFAELAADAKANCPVSKLFNATINLEAALV